MIINGGNTMEGSFTEASYENSIIELLKNMGYTYVYGPDFDRDLTDPLMEDQLRSSLEMINPQLPSQAITEAIYKLKTYEAGALVSKNEVFMDYLQNGVEVSYRDGDVQRSTLVRPSMQQPQTAWLTESSTN